MWGTRCKLWFLQDLGSFSVGCSLQVMRIFHNSGACYKGYKNQRHHLLICPPSWMPGTFSEHNLENHGVEQPWTGRHWSHNCYNCLFPSHSLGMGVEGDSRMGITTQLGQFLWIIASWEITLSAGCETCPSDFPSLQPLIAIIQTSFWTLRHRCF